jgi:hypothetical protein
MLARCVAVQPVISKHAINSATLIRKRLTAKPIPVE